MNKFYKLIGVIAGIAVIAFTVIACSDLEDFAARKTVTFSLDKKDNYSFTITVKGAKWKDFTYDAYKVSNLVDFPIERSTVDIVDEQNEEYWCGFYGAYPYENWKRTSDTVITATFVSGYTLKSKMEVEFYAPGSVWFEGQASELIVDGHYRNDYQINPAKSSIAWDKN